jgi:monovalent cation:proton antiporter-2 (CPA2) family protein
MDMGSLVFAFTLLITAAVIVPMSKLAGLGSIIGYIGAGVLIGPSVFGIVTEPETILHFSEFGVVMMLFLIGLELRPSELWRLRTKLLGQGGLQVVLSVAAIGGAMVVAGLHFGAAVALGMALALSSTAVALQIMQDKNLMQTSSGESAFAILLFQDIVVILMIALIPVLAAVTLGDIVAAQQTAAPATGGDGAGSLLPPQPQGIWYGAAVIGVFAGMILAGRLLLRPVFRMISRAGVREAFTAVALSLVVGAALLMGWLGLSAALGAFIGGVVLADSEYRHQLERDIEPFKALLLGLFFISVGMSMDLGVIADDPSIIVLGVIGLMGIKFVILFGVTRVMGLATPAALMTAVLLCQAGEFGFVLFQFARAEGLVSDIVITQASAVIALSMAMTPLLLIVYTKLIAPRFSSAPQTGDTPVDERERVLILGYGRVGQIAQRLLHTQDISATLIDHDGDHIQFVKQFGNRVFYGDATDVDLLRQAGAAHAKVIVIAMDNADQVLKAARLCKEHFPQAKLVARAHNRNDIFELMALGVDFVERETVRAALAMGRETLRFLGYEKERSDRLMDAFLRYDYQMIEETWEHRGDMAKLIEMANDTRDFLRRTLGEMDSGEEVEEVLEERLEQEKAS